MECKGSSAVSRPGLYIMVFFILLHSCHIESRLDRMAAETTATEAPSP